MVNIQLIVDSLDPRKGVKKKLSDLLPAIIKRGEEERFWSPNEKVVMIDTSFVIQCYHQYQLWARVAHVQLADLNVSPVVLPDVINELRGLELGQRTDDYGGPIVDSEFDSDLSIDEVRLDINPPKNLEEEVRIEWQYASPKYQNYLRKKQAGEEVEEPTISDTDVRVMAIGLMRAKKRLETYVVSGDSDITRTVRMFNEKGGYPLYIFRPEAPSETYFTKQASLDMLLTNEVVAQITTAETGHYLVGVRKAPIIGKVHVPLGFKVSDTLIHDRDYFSALIIDEEELKTETFIDFLNRYGWAVIKPEAKERPMLLKKGTRFVRGHKIVDPTKYYKDISLKGRATFRNGWPIVTPYPVAYLCIGDSYIRDYLPKLGEHLNGLMA